MKLSDLFKRKSSGDVAKDRLKMVLVSDRANCSPEIMERIKSDILEVLSKYAEVDKDQLDIHITQMETDETGANSVPALYANIPIRNIHHTAK
ncbi:MULTISPECIES: cell division topological specificity factor MinE [Butyrivibrio]|jgi:cell division topological specificity factor|uniref:Cell division topological specificity factor n=1 Tax=Butyrivibrio fibrisolvens TaxID=831 RepID=A0A317G6J0_BUTFI|nr:MULTISPECIES: cell division topological specificity factor MinE [Butyrivibrio]MCR4637209.1 cell division topological specificity factor MinE [Butyrivibrio sp.]PWT28120.1 cell division topological specificity factor MinE [Butyrivibrio fibrisolvens]SEP91271.1 cell division topological specificity factor [Butyrivibrio sp. TB]